MWITTKKKNVPTTKEPTYYILIRSMLPIACVCVKWECTRKKKLGWFSSYRLYSFTHSNKHCRPYYTVHSLTMKKKIRHLHLFLCSPFCRNGCCFSTTTTPKKKKNKKKCLPNIIMLSDYTIHIYILPSILYYDCPQPNEVYNIFVQYQLNLLFVFLLFFFF